MRGVGGSDDQVSRAAVRRACDARSLPPAYGTAGPSRVRESGLTVVLVTHELDIAQYASRIIVVRDGLITRDTPVYERRDATAEVANMPPPEEQLEEMPA